MGEFDFAANAASMGAEVIKAVTIPELNAALKTARENINTTVIYIETDREERVGGFAWWEVPVAQVSVSKKVQQAYQQLVEHKTEQKYY